MVTISASHSISNVLSGAAHRFAVHAIESERRFRSQLPLEGIELETALSTVMQYASGAIILSVADIECIANETFERANDYIRRLNPAVIGGDPTKPKNLTIEGATRWRDAWPEIRRSSLNALERLQRLLELADLEPLSKGERPGQDLDDLIKLRNELVHNAPKARPHGGPMKHRDSLEQRLSNRFIPSTLVPETYTYFWFRCLSAGCATWAYETSADITNEFNRKLGVAISIEPKLPPN